MSLTLRIVSLAPDNNEASPNRVEVFDKSEVTIGRLPFNDIVIDRPEISGAHVKFSVEEDERGQPRLFVTDLGSSNGTFIDNNRLAPEMPIAVEDRQRILVGTYFIKASIKASADANNAVSLMLQKEQSTLTLDRQNLPNIKNMEQFGMNNSDTPEKWENKKEQQWNNPKEDLFSKQPKKASKKLLTIDSEENNYWVPESPLDNFELARRVEDNACYQGSVVDCDLSDINFKAIQLFNVRGKIEYRGKGLSGVTIESEELGAVSTNQEGQLLFVEVPEQTRFTLIPSKPGYLFTPSSISGNTNSDLHVSFTATKLLNVSGIVSHNGKALVGVEVDGGKLGKTISNSEGFYCFRDVPEGTEYTITATKKGYKFVLQQ